MFRKYALVILVLLAARTTITAQFDAEMPLLSEISVIATRASADVFEVPSIVSNIDVNRAGNTLSSDIGDLLQFTPGVDVDNGPRRNGQVVSIRGFDDEAVITLVDGRRQNYESAHDGRFFIDPLVLKRVEIVKGSASAAYGGGAIGGVVSFETKDATDFLADGDNYGALYSVGYRSANNEYSPLVTNFGRYKNFNWLGSVSFRQSGDIELGNDDTLAADNEMLSGLLKLGYTHEKHDFKLQYQQFDNNSQEPNNGAGEITNSNPIVAKNVNDIQVGLKYEFLNESNTGPKAHVYYNTTSVVETDLTGSNDGRVQERAIETIGFTLDKQNRFYASNTQSHILSYGLEYFTDTQVGRNSNLGNRAGVPNASADYYGAYVQNEWTIASNLGDFIVLPALRFDQYESEDENNNSQDNNRVSPKLSFSYLPNDIVMFFGSISQAFRAPNLTELYSTGQHFPGIPAQPPFFAGLPNNNFVPNPDLNPETVTSYELGTGIRLENVLKDTDAFRLKGSYFWNEGDNFISQEINISQGTTRFINIADARIEGWEAEANYRLGNLSLMIGASQVNARDKQSNEYLPNVVPLTFLADIHYGFKAGIHTLGWRYRSAADNDRIPESELPTSSYAVHDLYYRYNPFVESGLRRFSIDIGIDNVFDEVYQNRFATLFEEGRSYVARVNYQL